MFIESIPLTNGKRAYATDLLQAILTSNDFKQLLYKRLTDNEFGSIDFINELNKLEGKLALQVGR